MNAEDVPTEVLDKIPSYFESLSPGMSPTQVLQTLHLTGVRPSTTNQELHYYALGFGFRTNRYIVLSFNMRTDPPMFSGGHLWGDGWQPTGVNKSH
jgi:hypothetical protein